MIRKAVRIFIFFILPVIIALIIIALIALPYVAKNYLNKRGAEYTGREMTVGQIRINYFTSTLRVIDFKLFEADGHHAFVTFDTLLVRINPMRLFASELNIAQIRVVKPEVNIVRHDTLFNFDDIITFIKSKPQGETDRKNSGPYKYILKNISLDRGQLTFTDTGANYTNVMKNLGFSVPYISYNQEEISKAGLKFYFENGGFFQALADYNQNNGVYRADFTVNKLDVAPFLPYTRDYFRLKSIAGLIDGEFHLSGNINKIDSVMLRGDGNITDFLAKDLTDRKVLGARQGHVILRNSLPMKYSFNFDTITLTEPYLYFEMKDSTNNFLNLMVSSGTTGEPFHYYYQINQLKIDNGLIDFRDDTHGEPFNYHLDQIALKVDSISSVSQWVNAYSTMRLNGRGKVKSELGINPSDPYELRVNFVVTNFLLSDLNIYSRYYVGFPIILGNMYYQGKTVIKARQITSENKLIIRNAKLGKKTGGLMNIPLKLALYLLKDIHGDVILDIPLTGDLNDPKTKIGRLIWQTLKNVVVKVVASPFLALSHLMGVDPMEVKGIQFDYADTTLTDRQLHRIKLFTDLEKKKPDMKIQLAYYNDAQLEKQEIAINEAGKLFNTATGSDYRKEKGKFSVFIAQQLKSDTVSVAAGSIQLIGNQKLDSIQQRYAAKRIRKIESALQQADSTTKITIFIPNKEAPENVGSRPDFELKYSVDE